MAFICAEKPKLSPTNTRALTRMKQTLRKHNATYAEQVGWDSALGTLCWERRMWVCARGWGGSVQRRRPWQAVRMWTACLVPL